MNRRLCLDVSVFVGLVSLAFVTRLVMLAPNFHAVTAAALFAGFYFRNRLVAALVPLAAMATSDWIIGGYVREVMFTVYGMMVLPIVCRGLLRRHLTAGRLTVCAVASTLLFYLATNAAVWHAGIWYKRGWDGLLACYTAGLPFLANALAGDLAFSAAFFGAYALACQLNTERASAPIGMATPDCA
ncbi:MAG: DUF6580 family putative transport protein [Pirellulales bacterium]